jgi:hypothetical protein
MIPSWQLSLSLWQCNHCEVTRWIGLVVAALHGVITFAKEHGKSGRSLMARKAIPDSELSDFGSLPSFEMGYFRR